MKVVVAPDSFKGSLSAIRAAEIMREAVLAVFPAARVVFMPLSDGGEGSLDIARRLLGGTLRHCEAPAPDGRTLRVPWLLAGGGRTAVVESAAVVGMHTVAPERRDPMRLSSEGLGVLLRDVFRAAPRDIVCALGGSVVNDCGFGMARALGYAHESVGAGGTVVEALGRVRGITCPAETVPPDGVRVTVLHDVVNPLTGPAGATAVYGPQKGLPRERVRELDDAVANYAAVVRRDVCGVDPGAPGCGAAGGLGFALRAFCGAEAAAGAEWFIEQSGLASALGDADFVITGEGRCDEQTAFGKVVAAVSREAGRAGVPVIACAGRVVGEVALLRRQLGLAALEAAAPAGTGDEEAFARAEELLFACVRRTLQARR